MPRFESFRHNRAIFIPAGSGTILLRSARLTKRHALFLPLFGNIIVFSSDLMKLWHFLISGTKNQ
jgi:hypothetical protein